MFKRVLGTVAFAAFAVGAAQAQDSMFGTTSEDTVTINATVDPIVRISGLPDSMTFNLGAAFFNQSGPNTTQRPMFCVYSNVTSAGTFRLSAQGVDAVGGNSNAWALSNVDDGTELAFNVNAADGVTSRQIGPGDNFAFSSAARTGSRPNTGDCSDTGNNMQLIVAFSKSDVLAANAGSYTGTITMIASAI